jgi:hypothetical protein
MARYVLKQYHRNLPGIVSGVKVGEWGIEAADLNEAVTVARKLLNDYQPPTDFAALWDGSGSRAVWEEGTYV